MVNRPPHWLPIEKTFDEFVKQSGGELVRDLITNVNPKKNADYLFGGPLVVAELKCLEKETFTEAYAKKIQKLADGWMRRGLILAYGRVQLQLRKLPLPCQEEWLRLLELPLQNNVVARANRQIKATIETLGLQNARGLLLLVSDGNYSLEPHALVTLIGRILNKK